MDLQHHVGLHPDGRVWLPDRSAAAGSILLKLAAMGIEIPAGVAGDEEVFHLAGNLFARYREQARLLADHLCPADRRIQHYLDQLQGTAGKVRLPAETLILDQYGLARELSLPLDGDRYENELVSSYRVDNGVLHNPVNDRRTTQGVFHVAEGGLPIPGDKISVPLAVFLRLLEEALRPPAELLRLPFTAAWKRPVETMVSLLLRPLVCPAVPKVTPEKRLEVRFFAPGGLVSNLDFVESIFGNAGDPHLPANDAGLDVDGWTGHSGCVILAPHLTRVRKKDLGLPCEREEELYNEGRSFKLTSRGPQGVMVTLIADNYFGYCKKEVKTQIGYSANLFGLAEEEHAGGALAFPTFNLGDRFTLDQVRVVTAGHRLTEVLHLLGDRARRHPSGYATDALWPSIHYMPEDMEIDIHRQAITWTKDGETQHLKLLPGRIYIHPSGYKVRMEKHHAAPSWRLVGTVPEGAFCHKPCTVSGGGKSEISKSLVDAVLPGSFFVRSFDEDMELVAEILRRSYDDARITGERGPARPLLSPERSLGSVVKLLTPSPADFTPEYNAWLESIPNHIRALVFIIKRFHRPEWGDDWLSHFGVDIINGAPGHELKHEGRKLVANYLRIGRDGHGAWRTYKLRQDFVAADKVQMEDDITASVVVPARRLVGLPGEYDGHPSLKLAQNCEFRLFQRPDDAVHPGLDRQAEKDMASVGLFCSNFQPLSADDMRVIREDVAAHDAFTPPMREHVDRNAARTEPGWSICSARPRIIGGKPTKNPRYLQLRPDMARPRDRYVAEMGAQTRPAAAAQRAGALPGDRRDVGPAEQPARDRDAAALRVRADPLPGVAGAVHGLRLLADGNVAEHDGGGVRGRAHQGAVQRPGRDRRPEQRAGLLPADRVRRVQLGRGFRGSALPGGPRHLAPHPRDLVPALPARARPTPPDRGRAPRAADGLRLWRKAGAGKPARLANHGEVRAHVLRTGVRQSDRRVHRRHPEARASGSGGLRGRRREHR